MNTPATRYAGLVAELFWRVSEAQGIANAAGIGNAGVSWGQTPFTMWSDIVSIARRRGSFPDLHANIISQFGQMGDHEELDQLARLIEGPRRRAGSYRPADPYRARLVGEFTRRAVFNRFDLRSNCAKMTAGMPVLFIVGERLSGKSHSWYYVQHIADVEGHVAVLIDVADMWGSAPCTAAELLGAIADQLGITVDLRASDQVQPDTWPRLLVGKLVGMLPSLPDDGRRRWILIDGVDRTNVTPDAIGLVEALARAAEQRRLRGLQLIVTGYSGALVATPPADRGVEHIQPIDRPEVERFFKDVGDDYGKKVDPPFLSSLMNTLYTGLGTSPDLGMLGNKAADLALSVFGGRADE